MKKTVLWIGVVILAVALAACAGPSRLERDFGTSHRLQVYNQVANVEAEKNLAPVEGMDGRAAGATVERYEKGFEAPQPPPQFTLSIGGGK